jgi:HK97 family phage portal protein
MLDRLKNLLRPPEAKASRTARLIALESGARARWTPRDYAALAREGYLGNAIVHRAVKLVAENAAACHFVLYEGAHERDGHPLLDLIARPNPRQDGASFLEAVTAYLLLAGNAYIEAVALDGQGGVNVRELYALRPDRMRVVPGPDGWAEAYDYTAAGRTVRFTQDAQPVPRSCT